MAKSNRQRVEEALELVASGFGAFVADQLEARYGEGWKAEVANASQGGKYRDVEPSLRDADFVLWAAINQWHAVFRNVLGHSERSLVGLLKDVRGKWAHGGTFSVDETHRVLDWTHLLLLAVGAPEAKEAAARQQEVLRLKYEEQVKKAAHAPSDGEVGGEVGGLPPWRKVIEPHDDVATGRYALAEFAADLRLVDRGEGRPEYSDPAEFFRRTYLTRGLRLLLVQTLRRMSGTGGDPVVDLMTTFGGGKTHSLLAVYHLCAGTPLTELEGMADVAREAGVEGVPGEMRRCVLIGNDLAPGRRMLKEDGSEVGTLWGELAWRLGGAEGFALVADDDRQRTNPGTSRLVELLRRYAPCVVLIDEWIAYARQLWNRDDLPAGSLDTHMSFAQSLSEAVKAVPDAMLIVSIPASDAVGEDPESVEVGGVGGAAALKRLRAVIRRTDSPWRPASAEESFEIVRRRLFKDVDAEALRSRDIVARRFADMYATQAAEFPREVREPTYEGRLRAAYPIHPELFDRLYQDWSALARFHRTRGVLRLMATAIQVLWARGDQSPLILPASLPLDDPDVFEEITSHLDDNWKPVVDTDVDGRGSRPVALDQAYPNLGRVQAVRRVARTVFMGSAPTHQTAGSESPNRGIEATRVKLGSAFPGDSPAVFGDALRRLSEQATHVYVDASRYWFSTSQSVAQLARERAERYDEGEIFEALGAWLRADRERGLFARVHAFPTSSAEVEDEAAVGLVVFGPGAPHARNAESEALRVAGEYARQRGGQARQYQNMLLFVAPDANRLPDLLQAIRLHRAWGSIDDDREGLNLDQYGMRLAASQVEAAADTVRRRIAETYIWLLEPRQEKSGPLELEVLKVNGSGGLAERMSRRADADDLVIGAFGASRLRMELDGVPLWRGDHLSVREAWDYFGRYAYLPRLRNLDVLLNAVGDGPQQINLAHDGFAYADDYDEAAGRYRGLVLGDVVERPALDGLMIKPDIATRQVEEESRGGDEEGGGDTSPEGDEGDGGSGDGERDGEATATRFYGRVGLDAQRLARDSGALADEIVGPLLARGLAVSVTVEIEANSPGGFDEHTTRTLNENARSMRFEHHEFE
jgi:predicted AAA+ superfamily ATPase